MQPELALVKNLNLKMSVLIVEVQKLKNAKVKRAKELYKEGYKKTDILKIIIKEFKLERDLNSRSWPKWLSNI